jgi:hypothetical protein
MGLCNLNFSLQEDYIIIITDCRTSTFPWEQQIPSHPHETVATPCKLYSSPSHTFVDYCMRKAQRRAAYGQRLRFLEAYLEKQHAVDEQIDTWQHRGFIKADTC